MRTTTLELVTKYIELKSKAPKDDGDKAYIKLFEELNWHTSDECDLLYLNEPHWRLRKNKWIF